MLRAAKSKTFDCEDIKKFRVPRGHRGKDARVGGEISSLEWPATCAPFLLGHIRSPQVEIEWLSLDAGSLEAEVRYIQSVRPLVRLGLAISGSRATIEVDFACDLAFRLAFRVGGKVFTRRQRRVFADGKQI